MNDKQTNINNNNNNNNSINNNNKYDNILYSQLTKGNGIGNADQLNNNIIRNYNNDDTSKPEDLSSPTTNYHNYSNSGAGGIAIERNTMSPSSTTTTTGADGRVGVTGGDVVGVGDVATSLIKNDNKLMMINNNNNSNIDNNNHHDYDQNDLDDDQDDVIENDEDDCKNNNDSVKEALDNLLYSSTNNNNNNNNSNTNNSPHNNNNNNSNHHLHHLNNIDGKSETSDDTSDLIIKSPIEAFEYGEKFLKWLESYSDPSVTAMQVMQFKYLLTSIKSSIDRLQQQQLNLSTNGGNGFLGEERIKIRRRK